MSDLLVSAFTPTLAHGQGLRTYAIARALALLGPVDLLYARFGDAEPAPEFHGVDGLTLHPVTPSRGARRAVAYATALAHGTPADFARGASPELAAGAAELARAPGRGRIVADGPPVAAALIGLARGREVIYNAHNLESAFRGRLEGAGRSTAKRLERFERRLLSTFAETWMASPADVEGARRLDPEARVRYIPNAIDVTAIAPVSPAGGDCVVFVGDFRYPPNREGFAFLSGEVMPRLWERRPGARLLVGGRGLERPAGIDERIEVLGFVPDLPALYSRAAAVAVPLLVGGGSPLKFVEALAYGLPVVATPTAAAGLEAEAGRDYLEAEAPEDFALALDRALAGEAAGAAAAGRSLVERAYSIESLADRIAGAA
jgi:glycosyltransferase involved in cell wall biosynthesis